MLTYYRIATHLIAPLMPLWLGFRARKGKEDRGRMAERFGRSSYGRPKGTLLWIHAASVGEANSALILILKLKEQFPRLGILLTTGTLTSAALMKKRLPAGVIHQYAPIDTPDATERFMRHWLPDVAWFVESELWPNLIDAARRYYCLMALVNARMSDRSFRRWRRFPKEAKELLSAFRICFAQSEPDAVRLKQLGIREVKVTPSLKYDAKPLSCDESELFRLRNEIGERKLWLAASTHAGEEIEIAKVHAAAIVTYPYLLTIIVPRHPRRAASIALDVSRYGKVAIRSRGDKITPDISFYIADTMGELGLFYRLTEIAFLGGSLISHGGQNPLEAAQLGCAIMTGTHVHNFIDIYQELQKANALFAASDTAMVATHLRMLLADQELLSNVAMRAKESVEKQCGAADQVIMMFAPIFAKNSG